MPATHEQWFEMADYDLETAKAMLKSKRYLYVGFMCNLAVEKSLKAIIAKNGAFPPKIHNLQKLAALGGINEKLSGSQYEFFDFIQPMQIEGRYETYKNDVYKTLNKTDVCEGIISQTEEFLRWTKELQ